MAARLPVLGTLLLVLLAGCAGSSGSRDGDAQSRDLTGVDYGAIVGQVLDEGGLPIEGARVGVLELADVAVTDEAGVFLFEGVSEGRYTLAAQKLGFVPVSRLVDVEAGVITEPVLSLVEVSLRLDPVVRMLPENGFVACSTNTYYPSNACSEAFGRNQDRFPVEIDPDLKLEQLILELDWVPASPTTGQHLELDLCLPQGDTPGLHCAQDDLNREFFRYESGGPPLRMIVDAREMPLDEHLEYEAWVGSGFASPYPTLQQPFTLYITACYEAECPTGYTALET